MPLKDLPPDAQPREKLLARGAGALVDAELIALLLRTGTRSTFDFRKAGIMAPAARIKEMNDKYGYYISRIASRDLWDDEGFMHPRVAVYQLIDEPHGERSQ